VTPEDIREILKERTPVVIATDWIGGGSNGLLLNLNDPVTHDFQFAYGSGSRWLHEQEALRLGLEATTIVTGGVAHDLDTTEDFRALIASGRKIPDWLRTLPIPHQETRV
jgi:2-phospho-L-lactate guanylyltransferase (CobY/MobA/RfbA family)